MGKRGVRRMGEMVCLGGEIKDSAPKKELISEIWGKGVCDIWEKWVVWVEKSNTCSRMSLPFLAPPFLAGIPGPEVPGGAPGASSASSSKGGSSARATPPPPPSIGG